MGAATADELFAGLAAAMVADGRAEEGTMMGYPCLRVAGRFFASSDRGSGALIIKVPAARVKELIAAGLGAAFAPAGRPFREGVAISVAQQHLWQDLLEEAYLYAIAAVAHEEAGGRRPSAID